MLAIVPAQGHDVQVNADFTEELGQTPTGSLKVFTIFEVIGTVSFQIARTSWRGQWAVQGQVRCCGSLAASAFGRPDSTAESTGLPVARRATLGCTAS